MIAASRRPSGPIARLVLLALLVAGCGATVPPIEIVDPDADPRPRSRLPRPAASSSRRRTRPRDRAPCGQKDAPDASHGAYTGQPEADPRRGRDGPSSSSCAAPDVAFLAKIADPAFGINDAGWLARARRSGDPRSAADHDGGRTGPARTASRRGTAARRSASPATTATGATRPPTSGSSSAGLPASSQRVDELQAGTVDGIDDVAPAGVEAIDADVSMVTAPRRGLVSRLSRRQQHVRPVRQRGRPAGARARDRPEPARRGVPATGRRARRPTRRRARSRTPARATPGTSSTRRWPRRRWPPPGSPTAS